MSDKAELTPDQARKLVLISQGIHRPRDFGQGIAASQQVLEHLGYIQIDTISVVERAHHHTFWNRVLAYHPDHIDTLVREKKAFEYWSHAAAFLPMKDFRYSLPRKYAIASGDQKYWHNKDTKLAKFILDRISQEGPLRAKDFEHQPRSTASGWWDWKPAKQALERLFMEGELMVVRRQGFQKVYDLTERALPEGVNTLRPDQQEHTRHLIRRYLMANGLGRTNEIAYLLKGYKPKITKTCASMLEERELHEVIVNGDSYFALTGFEHLLKRPLSRKRVCIFSPFDNLLIQRARLRELFGYDYQLECYKPKLKREYGYFVLPILKGREFVARMDAKNDRVNNVLTLKRLHLEVSDAISARDQRKWAQNLEQR